MRQAHDSAARRVQALVAARHDRIDPEHVLLVRGRPWEEIPRVALALEVDAVVMGDSERTGLARLIVGNTAERVAKRLRCAVIVVKAAALVAEVRPVLPRASVVRGRR